MHTIQYTNKMLQETVLYCIVKLMTYIFSFYPFVSHASVGTIYYESVNQHKHTTDLTNNKPSPVF